MSQNESTTFLVTDAKNLTLIDATRENSPWWYVALRMHTHTEKTIFFLQRRQIKVFTYIWELWESGQGTKAKSFMQKLQPFNNFYIDEAHTVLDIFCFTVFLGDNLFLSFWEG